MGTPEAATEPMNALRTRALRWLQVVGVLLVLAGTVAAFAFSRPAGAGTGVGASGNTVPNSTVPQPPFTAGTPFDSGQQIDIVIPPNSVLDSGAKIFILECAAPNGVLPTTTGSCDGNTGYQGGTVLVASDGSVDVTNSSTNGSDIPYTIYALPDPLLQESSSGEPKCGLGAANECVLYIGEGGGSDIGMSQPHFFSPPFQIHTDPTDSGTVNPGDGSPEPVSAVSAANSTVSPAAQTVAGDGVDPAEVTVTLKDQASVVVPGKTVSLAAAAGHAKIVPSQTGADVTDANGKATFFVTDSSAESVSLTAIDTTDNVTLTQTASVTFTTPTINTAASTVVASPTTVPSDGTTPSTITVTVKDNAVAPGQPAPLQGLTVTLSAESGSSVISPSSVVTDATGAAAFQVTDSTSQTVTYKANIGATVLTSTASVFFGTLASVSATASTVVVHPSPAFTGPSNGTTVTVTLLASDARTPVPNKSVSLSVQSPSNNASTIGGNSATTNASGQAVFTVIDQTAETVKLTATDVTDSNLVLASQPSVVFEAPPPPTISATTSSVNLANSPEPADGSSPATLTVTVRNTANAVVAGVKLTATASPTGTVSVVPVGGNSLSNSSGTVQFYVRDTVAETVTLTAAVVGGVAFAQTATAVFLAGAANANTSTVAASPVQVAADGTTPSTVTVTLTDYFGNVVAGDSMNLAPSGGTSVITPDPVTSGVSPGVTNAQGVAKFSVTDAKTEVVTYTATDSSTSLRLTQLASVTFGTPPPVLPVKADCTAVVNATSVPANGTTTGTVTVELRDGSGYPVAGKTVSLTPSGGSSVVVGAKVTGSIASAPATPSPKSSPVARPLAAPAAGTAVSNSNGNAIFSVSDKVPETVTYTAADSTDSISGWTVTVTYTVAAATTTTSTTTSTTTAAGGAAPAASTGAGSTAETSGISGDAGSAGTTGATDTSAAGPSLAFTGAPAALPWIFGVGALLLLLGTLGRALLTMRRRAR